MMDHRVVWLAGFVSRDKGVVPPEPIDFVPDANGGPPVPRALIPREGERCSCRDAALHQKSEVLALCA